MTHAFPFPHILPQIRHLLQALLTSWCSGGSMRSPAPRDILLEGEGEKELGVGGGGGRGLGESPVPRVTLVLSTVWV